MISDTLAPGVQAIIFGSIAIVVLFIPFAAVSYHLLGRMGFWRSVGWAALVVYSISLLTYTMLPAPPLTDTIRCVGAQLQPFQFISDILRIRDEGRVSLLRNSAVQQIVLNIALFVPLGVLIRALFARGVIVSVLVGATLSLAIEFTQLTGVWGLYNCAYRVFDVDDLIVNTLGAIIGSLVSIFVFSHRKPGTVRFRNTKISRSRRLVAMMCDVGVLWMIAAATVACIILIGNLFTSYEELLLMMESGWSSVVIELIISAVPFLIYGAVVMSTSATFGEHIVAIKAVTTRGSVAGSRLVRFVVGLGLYIVLVNIDIPFSGTILLVFLIVNAVFLIFGDPHLGLAQRISGSRLIDTSIAVTPGVTLPDRGSRARRTSIPTTD